MLEKDDNNHEKEKFLDPTAKYYGKFTPENLAFNANLQEFAQRVSYLCGLESNGKISTTIPCCTYYFGPFDDLKEAKINQPGYVEDLIEEKAQGIKVEIKRCQPQLLTIEENYFGSALSSRSRIGNIITRSS